MENLYKYFSSVYKYYRAIVLKNLIQIGMVGFQFAFFLSRQSFFQSMYRFLFVKRPRNSGDILIEPTDTQIWACKSQIISTTPSAKKPFFNINHSSLSSPSSFKIKEDYYFPPFSYEQNIIYEKDIVLWTYSISMAIDNIEKQFRIINSQPLNEHEFETLQPRYSSVSFLDIQYHHPKMKDSLILEVPKDWCCVGNTLFSPAFVLRMLYYQTLPFVFDMSYKLDIMDNSLNTISLDATQTIILKANSYNVA